MRLLLFVLVLFNSAYSYAQDEYSIEFPSGENWSEFDEGEEKSIQLNITGSTDDRIFYFSIREGKQVGMNIDSNGIFTWYPDYNLVDRIEKQKIFQLLIEAKSDSGDFVSQTMDLLLSHTNRPPIVNELKPFYIHNNTQNIYQFDNLAIFDEDGDPIVIIPFIEDLPEGMSITALGKVTWSPSYTQFRALQDEPRYVRFSVEDQPAKSRTNGRLKLLPTELDLSPTITVIPDIDFVEIKENETINIGFYLSDPNGDENIETFDFLSNHPAIRKQSLVQNTPIQYEFIWTPGYDFVLDPVDSVVFYIDFFVLDKSQQRDLKRINFRVNNTVNEIETDEKNMGLYRGTLARAWELMEQLKEKENELKKTYNKAKKGKKQRSVVNASLGAVTGLSSIFTKDNESLQRTISTIGGTTVLTIGTLEATEVIGKSMKDVLDRLNYVIEKKNEIQTMGDIFAREYTLKSKRRSVAFKSHMDNFMAAMNLRGLVALELDATWETNKTATDRNIRRTFKDFSTGE